MQHILVALSPSFGTLAASLWQQLRALWQRRARIRATAEALQALDGHLLHDLGLDRSEVVSVAVEIADLGTPLQLDRQASRRRITP